MKKNKLILPVLFVSIIGFQGVNIAKSFTPPPPPTLDEIKQLVEEQSSSSSDNVSTYRSRLQNEGLENASLVDCKDTYVFGNIYLNLTLDKSSYVPGDTMYIKGEILNKNNYHLPGVEVSAKIHNINNDGGKTIVKTVDEFSLGDKLNLSNLGKKDLTFQYKLPSNAPKGNYEILFYVTQYKQINLSGLSFTDDVYAFKSAFDISGEYQNDVSIIQSGITLNNEPYDNMSFTPKYFDRQPVTIKTPIKNNTNSTQSIDVIYEVYSWSDSLGAKNLLDSEKKRVTLAGLGQSIDTYVVEDIKVPVYYVKIKLKKSDSIGSQWMEIANIRFSNITFNKPIISFLGFNKSPYSKDGDVKLITCINNTNNSPTGGILENIVKDESGKVIASSKYEGLVSGQLDGIETVLKDVKPSDKFIVTSTIKDFDGNEINTIEMVYDCNELEPNKCSKTFSMQNIIILATLVIFFVGGSFVLVRIYKKKKDIRLNQ